MKRFPKNKASLLLRNKLKIVMVIDAWYPHVGGGQIHVWEIVKQMVLQGHQVVIVTRNLGVSNEKFKGVSVIRLGHFKNFYNILGRLEFLVLAFVYLLKIKSDIIHLHAFSPGLLAPIIRLFSRTKIVFTAHGNGMKIAGLWVSGQFLEGLVFYQIKYDLLITVAEKTFFKKPKTELVKVIPNGVNLSDFKNAQRKRVEVKKIVYFGRLFYDKGVDLLIDAFLKLKKYNLSLIVIGSGPELDKLKRKAKDGNIEFVGFYRGEELTKQLSMADLVVLPSRVEGMPLRLLEAWAAKIPVLLTDVGDNAVYVKDGVNGFLCKPTSESIYKSLIGILNNNNLNSITNLAYAQVKKYTWKNITGQTLVMYKKVLD
jgi:glycogen synthase